MNSSDARCSDPPSERARERAMCRQAATKGWESLKQCLSTLPRIQPKQPRQQGTRCSVLWLALQCSRCAARCLPRCAEGVQDCSGDRAGCGARSSGRARQAPTGSAASAAVKAGGRTGRGGCAQHAAGLAAERGEAGRRLMGRESCRSLHA